MNFSKIERAPIDAALSVEQERTDDKKLHKILLSLNLRLAH